MDETSPGKNRPDDVQLVAAVKREPSRMDTLLATLQRDIKTLCQQGDLVSQKVLHLYQTFEGVIHEATSISPRDAPTKLDDEDVAGDEDSGVAMATSEFQDVCSSDSRWNSKQASDSAVDDGKSSTLAWYEIEEDENDIETEVDDFTPKKAARNGLTEEWIKFGHFQLKGKHHELTRTGGNEASDKEDDTVLYDWESFTEEDDEITLAYDWEAFENSSDQGFHQDKIFRYSFEDKKVVPNVPRQYVQPVVNQSYHARELNRHNGEQRTNGFSEAVPSGTNNSQHSTDQDHTLKRRELYRKISSDILDKLSRRTMNEHLEPTETHKSTVLCDQKHRLCTCSHNDRVADVRATTSAHSRKEDKNNNSKPRSKHWQSSRIITNGSLECRPGNIKRKSQEREYGKTETVRAAGGKLDTSRGHRRSASDHQILERRPHQTAQRKLRKGDDATMKSNKRRTTDTYFAKSDFKLPAAPIDACLHSCSLSNIAGDRRPLFYDIEKALDSETTELPKCECTAIRKERTTVKFSHQFDDHLTGNTIGQYDSSDQVYDFTASLEAGYCEDTMHKRLTWDLADSSLPFDDRPLSRDRTPHLRASYAGPNKQLFPQTPPCNPSSNFSRCAKPRKTASSTALSEQTLDSPSHRESLRLCGIRYAGFQAAWPSINTVGNRRSFSGFTVVETQKDKNRWKAEPQQLQPTYC